MQTLPQIQEAVGAWSRKNFGDQDSKAVMHPVEIPHEMAQHVDGLSVPLRLGSLAPLLGVGEEIGELISAHEALLVADAGDAIGDILIYMCDYAEREGFQLPWGRLSRITLNTSDTSDPLLGVSKNYGRLLHTTLKYHQGIRGMDELGAYEAARMMWVDHLLVQLCRYTSQALPGTNPLMLVNETWNNVVKKRDWTADKDIAAGVTHTKDDGTLGTKLGT